MEIPSPSSVKMSSAARHLKQLEKLCSSELPAHLDTIYTNGSLKEGLQLRDFDALSHCLGRLSTLVKALQTSVMTDRNSVVPVSRLPNEILCQIFSLLKVRSLIQATHVCVRWRHAALADASLWGAHICQYPAFTREMLKRSGEVGIGIYWYNESESNDLDEDPPRKIVMSSLRLALAQSYRATEIDLYGHGKLITSALSKVTTEAPMLRSMSLIDDCAPSSVYYCLASNTFSGHVPHLRHIVLRGISCPPSLFHNLTRLDAGEGALGKTGRDILASMSRLPPSLEMLKITEMALLLDTEDTAQPEGNVLTFPSLQELSLKTTTGLILWLMRRLSFQHRLRLTFDVGAGRMTTPNVTSLVPYMPIRTTSRDAIFVGALEGLSINSDQPFSSTAYIHLDAWYSLAEPLLASSNRRYDNGNERAPDIDLFFLITIVGTDHLRFCLRLLGTPCLESVTCLRLVAKDGCASALAKNLDSTIELFIQLPSLRSCILVGGYIGVFVKALAVSALHGPGKPHDELEELVLAEYDFGDAMEQIVELTDSLTAYVQSRHGGLKRVRLVNLRGIGSDALADLFRELRGAGVPDVMMVPL